MDIPTSVTPLIEAMLAPAAVAFIFFKSDDVLSKDAAKAIGDAIKQTAAAPDDSKWAVALAQFLDDAFPPKGQPGKFWLNVLLFTALSLIFFLAVYTSRMTGLLDQLLHRGFLMQFLGNGLLVTLAVNAFAYSRYRSLIDAFSRDSMGRNLAWIAADLALKAVLFIVLTALVYVLFALLFGAFRGDVKAALHAVPITIREAIFFRNLTAVYLYAITLASFPLYIAVFLKLLAISPAFARFVQRTLFFFPIAEKPIRAAAMVFAVLSAAFCVVLSLLVASLPV